MFLVYTGHAAWSYSDCDGTYRHITVSDWIATCLIYLCCLENVLLSYFPFAIDAMFVSHFRICFLILIFSKKKVLFWIIWEALGWSKAIGLQEVWHISTLRSRGSKGFTKLSKTWVPSTWGTSWRRSHLWAFFKCLDESKVEFWCGWLSLIGQLVPVYFPPTREEAGVHHTS